MATKKLTPELVKKFYKHFTKNYGMKIVDKDNAAEMEMVGWFLDLMGIQDKDDFLNNYTTTIGNRIYISFEVGSKEIPLDRQIETLVHELHHKRQMNRDNLFMIKYALDKDYRALKEARAYTTNLEMRYWYCGKIYNTDKLALVLRGYDLDGEHIRVVKKHLRIHGKVAKQGGIENKISQQAIRWLNVQQRKLFPRKIRRKR